MYIFFDLSLFASLPFEQKHPLPVLSSVFSPKLLKNQDFRNGWGFSVLEACFTKIQKFFSEKTKKRRLFFLQKSVNTKKFPSKL